MRRLRLDARDPYQLRPHRTSQGRCSVIVLCILFHLFCAVGKYDRTVPLSYLRHVEGPTLKLHESALAMLQSWLDCEAAGVSINTLVLVPSVLAVVIAEYGCHLFTSGAPLYRYLVFVTAFLRQYQSYTRSGQHRLLILLHKPQKLLLLVLS